MTHKELSNFAWAELGNLTWGELELDKFELLRSLLERPNPPTQLIDKLSKLCDEFVESYEKLDISKKYPVPHNAKDGTLLKLDKVLKIVGLISGLISIYLGVKDIKEETSKHTYITNNYNISISSEEFNQLKIPISNIITDINKYSIEYSSDQLQND